VKEVKELKKDNVDFKNQVNGMEDKLDHLINLIADSKASMKLLTLKCRKVKIKLKM